MVLVVVQMHRMFVDDRFRARRMRKVAPEARKPLICPFTTSAISEGASVSRDPVGP